MQKTKLHNSITFLSIFAMAILSMLFFAFSQKTEVYADGTITITYDRTYTPTQYTNDDTTLTQTFTHATTVSVGDQINLPTTTSHDLNRFGYTFAGWRIGNHDYTISETTYTVNANDVASNNITATAIWTINRYSLPIEVLEITQANVEISVDGGTNWYTLANVHSYVPAITYNGTKLTFTGTITYGQTVHDYFDVMFGYDIMFRDSTGDKQLAYLSTENNAQVDIATQTFDIVGTAHGFLDTKNTLTLAQYDTNLATSPFNLKTKWETKSYDLVVDTVAGWSVLVNGTEQTAVNGVIDVPINSTITFQKTVSSNASFSYWKFLSNASTLAVIYPQERTFTSTDSYVYYDFTMPRNEVCAFCGGAFATATDGKTQAQTWGYATLPDTDGYNWVDIAQSPITMAENVTFNNRTMEGFWYTALIPDMSPCFGVDLSSNYVLISSTSANISTYFYEAPFANRLNVTSNKVATQNQLKIVNAMSVYIKDVNMVSRPDFLNRFVGTYVYNSDLSSYNDCGNFGVWSGFNASFENAPNILKSNTTNKKYNLSIYVVGTQNTVGLISQGMLSTDKSYYGKTYIYGTTSNDSDSVLNLGSAIFSENITISAKNNCLTINEYSNTNFEPILLNLGTYNESAPSINYATINAEHHSFACAPTYLYWSYDTLKVKNVWACAFNMSNGYVHVYGSMVLTIHNMGISSTTLIVEGSVYSGNATNGMCGISSSTVIVKGTTFALGACGVSNSKIICNTFTCHSGLTVSNSTIITNIITQNLNYGCAHNNSTGEITAKAINSTNNKSFSISGADFYPFVTNRGSPSNAGSSGGKYHFNSNSKVYLFGYYNTVAMQSYPQYQVYDLSITALTDGNPVKPFLTSLLDANGNYTNDWSIQDSALISAIQTTASGYNTNKPECIKVGYTDYSYSNVKITAQFNGASVYSAGNLTLFNETTVTAGTITCYGTFSSKQELIVTGGTITATEIGNAYNKTTTENSALCWQQASFENCTLNTSYIGAISKQYGGQQSYSKVTFGENVIVNSSSGVTAKTDIHANYFYDDTLFSIDSTLPINIQFSNTNSSSSWTATMNGFCLSAVQTFTAPTISGTSQNGSWLYGGLSGDPVTQVSTNGVLDDTISTIVYTLNQLSLYAVKAVYALSIVEGASYVDGITSTSAISGTSPTFDVNAGGTVTITFTTDGVTNNMPTKTVVWYVDAAGIYHNVANFAYTQNSVSFTMPYNNADVYITNELTLYLNLFPVNFMDNGFAIEKLSNTRRADSVFEYHGNYLITQQNFKTATTNTIIFETANSGNLDSNDNLTHAITLYGVHQTSIDSTTDTNTVAGNAKLSMTMRGLVYLNYTTCDANVTYKLIGEANSNAQLVAYTLLASNVKNSGNVTLKDFKYVQSQFYTKCLAYNFANVLLDGITTDNQLLYSISGSNPLIVAQTATINNCNIKFLEYVSYLLNTNSCFINNSTINIYTSMMYGGGGTGYSYSMFSVQNQTITLNNSTMTYTVQFGNQYATNIALGGTTLVLNGTSTFTADHRLMLYGLTLNDNSTFTIGSSSYLGYLLCPNVTLNGNATLNADYVLLSGFSTGNYDTESEVISALNARNVLDGASYNGLIINDSATLNADNFVGGNVNGKITINGGIINTPNLGTNGTLYGYHKFVPADDSGVFMYSVTTPVVNSTITMTGGTVNVSANGYIGGMNSTIKMTGGTINLDDGATMGLTSTQRTTLENYAQTQGTTLTNASTIKIFGGTVEATGTNHSANITAPYGTITINETDEDLSTGTYNTQVKVNDITSDYGTIKISKANDGYTNDCTISSSTKNANVGVYAYGQIQAQNVRVLDNASVFGSNGVNSNATSGTTGVFEVAEDLASASEHTSIYTNNTYGANGQGTITLTTLHKATSGGTYKQNVYGISIFTVVYQLNDLTHGTDDTATNTNISNYTVGQQISGSTTYTLTDPTRVGFTFDGWYAENTFSTPVTQLDLNFDNDASSSTLYAKWTVITYTVYLCITDSVAPYLAVDTEDDVEAGTGTLSADQHTFTYTRSDLIKQIDYKGNLLSSTSGTSAIYIPDYTLSNFRVVSITSNTLGSYTGKSLDFSDVITKTFAQELANAGTTTITLNVEAIQQTRLLISLSLNLDILGTFDYETTPDVITSTTIGSYLDVSSGQTKYLYDVKGFTKSATPTTLITADAPNYVFMGWYLDQACTTAVTGSTVIDYQYRTYYAKWTSQMSATSAVMALGKVYDAISTGTSTISLSNDGSFSTKFVLTADDANNPFLTNNLRIAFREQLSQNTKLTFIDFSTSLPTYYYYIFNGSEDHYVNLTSFIKMGTSSTSYSGTYYASYTLQIIIDYADSTTKSTGSKHLDLEYFKSATVYNRIQGAILNYSLSTFNSTITVTNDNVDDEIYTADLTITTPNDSRYNNAGHLMLVGELDSTNTSFKTVSTLTDNGNTINGVCVNDKLIVFDLGTYTSATKTYNLSISDLPDGAHTITWNIAWMDSNNTNLENHLLTLTATASTSSFTTSHPAYSFDVSSITVDNTAITTTEDKILAQNSAHTIQLVISYTNIDFNNVNVEFDKATSFRTYSDITSQITITKDSVNNKITLDLPNTLTAGTYQICLSFKSNKVSDNYYITFIIKD